ncbi:MAG: hypothetical protein ABIO68_00755 [Sphingomicrobium sp.]
MNGGRLEGALERAEFAVKRIERSLGGRAKPNGRDDELRSKVRDAVAELDQLIREATQ